MYLIDSDTLIALGRGKTFIQDRINRCGINNCVLSEISLAELYVGVYKIRSSKEELFLQFLENLDKMDLFIAATALVNDYTLVTHNTRHFSRIPGLKLEDWIEE